MGHFHEIIPTLRARGKPEVKILGFFRSYSLVFGIVFVLLTLSMVASGIDYCYDKASCGPKTWEGVCQSGRRQSPINIRASRVKIRLQSSRIVLNRNYIVPRRFYMLNNGHTVQVSLNQDQTSKSYLFGDGLGRKPYYFSQLHFHWGANIREGSEHRISGRQFPLEMHLVHKQVKEPTKLAVVAVLFYISPRDNPRLGPIIRNLGKVSSPSDSPTLMPEGAKITLTSLLPRRMRMFRYVGSLTTPPCTENVLWTVFTDPIPISRRQLAVFRRLKDAEGLPMKRTFRPPQPLYNPRKIYFIRTLRKS